MNGATADPWLRTTNPPKTAIMTITGNSQNFLRILMNAQSSVKKSMLIFLLNRLKLLAHGFRRRPWGVAFNPVTFGTWIEPPVEGVLANHPHDQGNGGDGQVEQ